MSCCRTYKEHVIKSVVFAECLDNLHCKVLEINMQFIYLRCCWSSVGPIRELILNIHCGRDQDCDILISIEFVMWIVLLRFYPIISTMIAGSLVMWFIFTKVLYCNENIILRSDFEILPAGCKVRSVCLLNYKLVPCKCTLFNWFH